MIDHAEEQFESICAQLKGLPFAQCDEKIRLVNALRQLRFAVFLYDLSPALDYTEIDLLHANAPTRQAILALASDLLTAINSVATDDVRAAYEAVLARERFLERKSPAEELHSVRSGIRVA